MKGGRKALIAIIPAAILLASGGAHAGPAHERDAACHLDEDATVTVARIADAETLVLSDLSEVRLIGALGPRGGEAPGLSVVTPSEQAAITALEGLVLGKTVALAYAGRRTDRYGRRLAHVFVNRDGARIWVQGELVAAGYARAYVLPGNAACAVELMEWEAHARDARLGLWALPAYAVRAAGDLPQLARDRNAFAIVEGRVETVTKGFGEVRLAFAAEAGAVSGFTVRIVQREAHMGFTELSALRGHTVRVRGWIERREAPFMRVFERRQIEALQDASSP